MLLHRRAALAALAAPLLHAQRAPKVDLNIHRLSGKMFALTGSGGNMLAAITGEGFVLIDSGLPEQAGYLPESLAGRLAQIPIRLLINTHWHFDNTGGNVILGRGGTEILSHPNTQRHLSRRTTVEYLNRTFDALPRAGRPKRLVTAQQRMTVGNLPFDLLPLPPAHTDGDLAAFFPNQNVLHTGDVLVTRAYPVIDYTTGGRLAGMVEASRALLKMADARTQVVPGHGPVRERADLEASLRMLEEAHARLSKLLAAGAPTDEVVARRPMADHDAAWGDSTLFVRTGYESLRRKQQQP